MVEHDKSYFQNQVVNKKSSTVADGDVLWGVMHGERWGVDDTYRRIEKTLCFKLLQLAA